MIRIAGVNLDENKKADIVLSYIFGIGPSVARNILKKFSVENIDVIKLKDIPEQKLESIKQYIEKELKVEGDLRVEINQNLKRLKEIDSYRGARHSANLPVRGQRTKTNNRTKRGKKVTVGSGRKKSAEKT